MPKVIPVIITNDQVLIKDRDSNEFIPFEFNNYVEVPNIPFYHQYAQKIAESQNALKKFIRSIYGSKASKSVLAIVVPDDTSKLESIFINEFFLHCDACKAVAQCKMGQVLSKENCYISISKSMRNVILQYIRDGQVVAKKYYDINCYDAKQIINDAKRVHIDVEYLITPIYINDFSKNMEEFYDCGEIIKSKKFMSMVSKIEIEKNK